MPCKIPDHKHEWPEEGEVIIQRCERYCAWCKGDDKEHEWKFPWFLRRHLKTHIRPGDHPKAIISDLSNSAQAITTPNTTPRKRASPSKKQSPTKKTKATPTKVVSTPTRKRGVVKKAKTPESTDEESELSELGDESPESIKDDDSEDEKHPSLTPPKEDVEEVTAVAGADANNDSGVDVNAHDESDDMNALPDTPATARKLSDLREGLGDLALSHSNVPGAINPVLLLLKRAATPTSLASDTTPRALSITGSSRSGVSTPDPFGFPSRAPQTPGETNEAAIARHLEVYNVKLAYRTAMHDLAKQGIAAGLTPVELGFLTADEVDRLFSLGNAWLVPHNTPDGTPVRGHSRRHPSISAASENGLSMVELD